jgi:hypothetical protein
MSMSLFAQTTLPTSLPFDWEANLALINGFKGVTGISLIFIITKVVNNIVLAGWLDKMIGRYKLLTVSAVSIALSVIGLLVQGGYSAIQIVMATITLTASQVFLDQFNKQVIGKKGDE